MERSWRWKRNQVYKFIKQVSDENGGDDIEWLRNYAKEVVKEYAEELETAIACFESLIRKEAKCLITMDDPLSPAANGGVPMRR